MNEIIYYINNYLLIHFIRYLFIKIVPIICLERIYFLSFNTIPYLILLW